MGFTEISFRKFIFKEIKVMNLYTKVVGDTQFVNEIKYLNLNSESLNSESHIDLKGVDEESVDFKIINFTKNQRFDKKTSVGEKSKTGPAAKI